GFKELTSDYLSEEMIETACFDKRFCKIRYQPNEMIPLKKEVMVMAHHTPVTPMRVPRTMASGIRSVLKTMLVTAGGVVLPNPLNMPCVVISSIMKSCEKPRINR